MALTEKELFIRDLITSVILLKSVEAKLSRLIFIDTHKEFKEMYRNVQSIMTKLDSIIMRER